MPSSLFQNQENQQNSKQMLNNTLNEVKQMVQGRNPQEVFFEECKKRGVDANSILSIARLFNK